VDNNASIGSPAAAPQRHGCLTAILIVFGILSLLAACVNLAMHNTIASRLPNAPDWAANAVLGMGILGLLGVVGLVALWYWKRWGLFLYIVVGIVVFVVNMKLVGIVPSLLGLVGIALVTIFVMRQWQDFH